MKTLCHALLCSVLSVACLQLAAQAAEDGLKEKAPRSPAQIARIKLSKLLKLSDDQKTQIDEILVAFNDKSAEARKNSASLSTEQIEKRKELLKAAKDAGEKPNMKAINEEIGVTPELQKQMMEGRKKLNKLRQEMLSSVKKVLDEEQTKTFTQDNRPKKPGNAKPGQKKKPEGEAKKKKPEGDAKKKKKKADE
ncbi:hypothetical protein [Calycomorphotria hydatis]|uniref:LTXXQ motif protein n=1 Tax=Calycomorphotria hydatis TaxID=2528027 RepID=A0A517T5Y6_9PLAN|nr:hypothetical protein [Calycomorphotria hydatis]QDT63795.1 hypothetical protein V22_10200 [Calycomorphotria hydatis]